MRKITKKVTGVMLACCLTLTTGISAAAATSGKWSVDYTPGAPSNISHQTDTIILDYYSGGYKANCKSISGSNGRRLTISSSSAGGMYPVSVTSTGSTKPWTMEGSTTGNVKFYVSAETGYRCVSTGVIKINT